MYKSLLQFISMPLLGIQFQTCLQLWVEYELESVAISKKDSKFHLRWGGIAQQGGFEHSSKSCQHQCCGQQFHQGRKNRRENLHIYHAQTGPIQNVSASLPERFIFINYVL